MAIAISLFVVFLSLFVVMLIVKRGQTAPKKKTPADGSTGSAAWIGGGDTGGSRKGASDSDGQDSGGGDGGGGGGGD